jgi:hypothetical protein
VWGGLAWCGAVLLLAGCGQSLPPGKIRVNGVVELDGARLQSGIVHFFAKAGSDSGAAAISPQGQFSVVLSPGEYGVAVVAKDGNDKMDERGKVTLANSLVAEKYASTSRSGITVAVAKGGGPVTIAVEGP